MDAPQRSCLRVYARAHSLPHAAQRIQLRGRWHPYCYVRGAPRIPFTPGEPTMKTARTLAITLALLGTYGAPVAWAQGEAPLDDGRFMAWGSLGWQGDFGGSVNSSGIGTIGARPAELNANTWGERYDPALIFRVGGAYNLTERSQLIGAFSWEQAEADETEAGLLAGFPLSVDFSDYQAWGIDVGYRRFYPMNRAAKPF